MRPGNVSCGASGMSALRTHIHTCIYNGLVPRQLLAYITRPHFVESSVIGTFLPPEQPRVVIPYSHIVSSCRKSRGKKAPFGKKAGTTYSPYKEWF